MTDISSLGTILTIWAHPDDEAYLASGIMAAAATGGQRVVCVTATKGELGSQDHERWPLDTLGHIRASEMMESLGVLGIKGHHWLGYTDGSLDQIPGEEGVQKIVAFIKQIDPDSILTFGPEGLTGHSDHKAICDWSTQAFQQAAKDGARLFYVTLTAQAYLNMKQEADEFNVFFNIDQPPLTPVQDLAISFELSPELLETKIRALLAHNSQVDGLIRAYGQDFFRRTQGVEYYRLGAVKSPAKNNPEA